MTTAPPVWLFGPFLGHVSPRAITMWACCVDTPPIAGQANRLTLLVAPDTATAVVALPPRIFNALPEIHTVSGYREKVVVWRVAICSQDQEPLPTGREIKVSVERVPGTCSFTLPDDDGECSLVFGSCRTPTYKHSLLWACDTDSIFQRIQARTPSCVLHIGDQIYGDFDVNTILWVRPRGWVDKYLAAFGTPKFGALMRSCPNYMILDDHEVQNAFPAKGPKNWRGEAGEAYRAFQHSHNPQTGHYYYSFDLNRNARVFVMDVRTERIIRASRARGVSSQVISPEQLQALTDWLEAGAAGNAIHFVVSSGPVFGYKDDTWGAFPDQQIELLDLLAKYRRVVFLSGDVHHSSVMRATMTANNRGQARTIYQIVSSPLVWDGGLVRKLYKWAGKLSFKVSASPQAKWTFSLEAGCKPCFDDNYVHLKVENNSMVTVSCIVKDPHSNQDGAEKDAFVSTISFS